MSDANTIVLEGVAVLNRFTGNSKSRLATVGISRLRVKDLIASTRRSFK